MQLVESKIALTGANLLNFNLARNSKGMVTIDPLDIGLYLNGQTLRYNEEQGTMAVIQTNKEGFEQCIAIGFIGHGCVIFDCLYFESELSTIIKLIAKLRK